MTITWLFIMDERLSFETFRCPDCGVGKVGVVSIGKGAIVWRCEICQRAFGCNRTKSSFVSGSKSIPIEMILKHQGYT